MRVVAALAPGSQPTDTLRGKVPQDCSSSSPCHLCNCACANMPKWWLKYRQRRGECVHTTLQVRLSTSKYRYFQVQVSTSKYRYFQVQVSTSQYQRGGRRTRKLVFSSPPSCSPSSWRPPPLHRNCRNLAPAQLSAPHFLADPTILLCPLAE